MATLNFRRLYKNTDLATQF